MHRDQILQRARELADAMLPDPSVIPADEHALAAAESVVAGAELECSEWGETLDYRGRPPCPEEQLPELRVAVVRCVARLILRHRLDVIVTWPRFAGSAS